uniref:Cadherin domain-containing protein n=1 Tax=Nothobranchius furzeri TaxID=105023 RepID=A0A8C6K7J6_NOTFU
KTFVFALSCHVLHTSCSVLHLRITHVSDPDSGHFSVQQYKLSPNDHFRLEVKDKGEDGKIPILVVQKSLDRETTKSHSLILSAVDGGKPPKSGNMNIIIKVVDINDNAPVFSDDNYEVTLYENASAGTLVIQLNASDLDEGPNGDVVYSFSQNVHKNTLKLFNINSATGEITVKGQINYEKRERYEIEIQASDKGLAPLTAEKSVIIKIVDVNDNTPEIEVTSFSSSIPEDCRPGTTVALISVNDLDSGLNGKVICNIKEDVPFSLSPALKDKSFSLVTKSPLDREKQSHYDLTITAKDADKGTAPLTSYKSVLINIIDMNDNSPEIEVTSFSSSIKEDSQIGTTVALISVSDLDSGMNGKVMCMIKEDAPFSLSPSLQENMYGPLLLFSAGLSI